VFIAGQRGRSRIGLPGDRITNPYLCDVFQTGCEIAYLSGLKLAGRTHIRTEYADLKRIEGHAGGHQAQHPARGDTAIHHANVRYSAFVGVIMTVEYERPKRLISLSARWSDEMNHCLKQVLDIGAILGRDPQYAARGRSQDLLDLLSNRLGLR